MKPIKLSKEEDLKTYTPSDGLKEALNISIALGRPLLLAGKPSTGKTQFAHWYARYNNKEIENENDVERLQREQENEFNTNVFQFDTKSTSIYTDLFYRYDAVSHFRNKDKEDDISKFIELTALGKAIICAKNKKKVEDETKAKEEENLKGEAKEEVTIEEDAILKNEEKIRDEKFKKIIAKAGLKNYKPKSVVLIDEIDKAPRDFPNDLLHEIENLSFCIKEIDQKIELNDNEKQNIVIIMTSNDEKNLPDAFLRRCLFHYIEFPTNDQLLGILKCKLYLKDKETGIKNKLEFFKLLCDSPNIDKKPSTSECIDWINYLDERGALDKPLYDSIDIIETSISIILKKKEDLDAAKRILNELQKANVSNTN